MLVYEITSYQGCHHEASDESFQQGNQSISSSQDEQIIGQPWDFQQKYGTTKFFMTSQRGAPPFRNGVSTGSCDV